MLFRSQDPARLDLTTSSLAPSSAGEQILSIFGQGPSVRDVAPKRADECMYLGLGLGMDSGAHCSGEFLARLLNAKLVLSTLGTSHTLFDL